MFSSNKSETPKSLSETAVANRFNKGTIVTGDISTETDLRIEGIINGEMRLTSELRHSFKEVLLGAAYLRSFIFL